MHYVLIIDPGVSGSEPKGKYPPYDKGLTLDIFIKDPKGKKPIVGRVSIHYSFNIHTYT